MHSVAFVKRQAAADAALQEKVWALAAAHGQAVSFDTGAARGDANLRRLLWMEQAAAVLDALLAEPEAEELEVEEPEAEELEVNEPEAEEEAVNTTRRGRAK